MRPTSDLSTFLESLPIGAYEADALGRITYCNQAFAEILGYKSPQDLVSVDLHTFYPEPAERDRLIAWMQRHDGCLVNETVYLRNRIGRPLVVSDSSRLLTDPADPASFTGVRGIMIDVGYRKLIDRFNAGIYVIDTADRIVRVNRAVARIFGYEHPRELEGTPIVDLYDNPADLEALHRLLAAQGSVDDYRVRMRRKDGRRITISVSAAPFIDSHGKVLGHEGTLTDVTETLRTMDILDDMPMGAYRVRIIDGVPRISYCNAAFARQFGYSKQELVGLDIRELYAHSADVEAFERELLAAHARRAPIHAYELTLRRKDGTEFPVEIDCFWNEDETGNIVGREGTVRDLRLKLRLEAALNRVQDVERFAHRFMAPIMSIAANTEAILDEIRALIEAEVPDGRRKDIGDLPADGVAIAQVLYRLSAALVPDMLELAAALPAPHVAAAELEREADEIGKLAASFGMEKIVELREALRRVATTLSLLLKDPDTSAVIRTSANRLRTRLSDLSKFYIIHLAELAANTAKIGYVEVESLRSFLLTWEQQRDQTQHDFIQGNFYDCVAEVVNVYQAAAFDKYLTIHLSKKGYVPRVDMIADDIKWMLHYIIQNAVKYAFKREGYIRVEVSGTADTAIVEVEDYGIGICEDEIASEKIFQYGYRGRFSGDMNRTGSGIGLSEARRIVDLHGGDISVCSIPVPGTPLPVTITTPHITTVRVTLPAVHPKSR